MAEPSAEQQDHARRRRLELGTLVALVGLAGSLLFNTISVRQSVDQAKFQARQARETSLETQIGMLTGLSSFLQQTDTALARTRAERARCNPRVLLSASERSRVLAEVESYDYLAWLFNQRIWRLSPAKRYWGPSMLNALDIAESVYDPRQVDARFRQLVRFRKAVAGSIPPARPCGRG